jgi:hypothetical protein
MPGPTKSRELESKSRQHTVHWATKRTEQADLRPIPLPLSEGWRANIATSNAPGSQKKGPLGGPPDPPNGVQESAIPNALGAKKRSPVLRWTDTAAEAPGSESRRPKIGSFYCGERKKKAPHWKSSCPGVGRKNRHFITRQAGKKRARLADSRVLEMASKNRQFLMRRRPKKGPHFWGGWTDTDTDGHGRSKVRDPEPKNRQFLTR